MKCALCQTNQANQRNTHYLTDSIIRTCLNQDGSNVRETGFYFDISNETPYIDFNFQRETSIEKLERSLGRKVNDEEIEKAKKIPFSVDYVFCKNCEDLFTKIETSFIEKILPKFRNSNLTGTKGIELEENKITKLFFYLQVWRTAVCEDIYEIETSAFEILRNTILNNEKIDNDNIPIFPIHITYLQVLGDEKEYTSNLVGCTNDTNPNIIFMNDFVIQLFDSENSISEIEFYGLNDTKDLKQLINLDNKKFKIKILENDRRLEIITRLNREEKVQQAVSSILERFIKKWFSIFGSLPNQFLMKEYADYVTEGDFDVLKYTEEVIGAKENVFISNQIK